MDDRDLLSYLDKTEFYINDVSKDFISVLSLLKSFFEKAGIDRPIISTKFVLKALNIVKNRETTPSDDRLFFERLDDIDICVEESCFSKISGDIIDEWLVENDLKLCSSVEIKKDQILIIIGKIPTPLKIIIDIFYYPIDDFFLECDSIKYDLMGNRFLRTDDNIKKIFNVLQRKIRIGNLRYKFNNGIFIDLMNLTTLNIKYGLKIDDEFISDLKIVNSNIERSEVFDIFRHDVIDRRFYLDSPRVGYERSKFFKEIDVYFGDKLKSIPNINKYLMLLKDFLSIKAHDEPFEISSKEEVNFIVVKCIFIDDLDFVNICHNENFNKSIFFYSVVRMKEGMSFLEVGFHSGKEWNKYNIPLSIEDNLSISVSVDGINIFINKNKEFSYSFDFKKIFVFDRDIKNDSRYGYRFEKV